MAKMLEMNADLVRAPRMQRAFDERGVFQLMHDAPRGLCGPSAPIDHCHLFAMHGMAADGVFDDAACFLQMTRHKREVDFRYLPAGELRGEVAMCCVVLCNDDTAAGLLV